MTPKRDNGIVLVRVLATILLLLCHTVRYYTFIPFSQDLSEVFNVCVNLFFLISGYLFNHKRADSIKKYLYRYLKLKISQGKLKIF